MQELTGLHRFISGDEVSVWVPVPVDMPYSYKLAAEQVAAVGSLVKVPVGSRELYGIIIGSAPESNFKGRLRFITKILDVEYGSYQPHEAGASSAAAAAGIMVKDELHTPHAEAVTDCLDDTAAAVVKGDVDAVARAVKAGLDGAVAKFESGHKLAEAQPIFTLPFLNFIQSFAAYTITPIGLAVEIVLRGAQGEQNADSPIYLLAKGEVNIGSKKLSAARERVLAQFDQHSLWDKIELMQAAKVSRGVIDAMLDGQLLKKVGQKFVEKAYKLPACISKLSQEQAEAAKILTDSIDGGYKSFLLEGVTGSGKTEVYFAAVEKALKLNQQVLLLMPEIALTEHFIERFAKRFGFIPMKWHYGLSAAKRARIWRWVAEDRVRVILGVRSALFLPFRHLGLIILDEEHDSAYKQEARIFYNARDMAVLRAFIEKIPIILASATPSIESQVNVNRGKYIHIILPNRIGSASLPQLESIDMRKFPPAKGKFLSPILVDAVRQTISRGEQALLFLNRRGYAPTTMCRECGYKFVCQHCTSSLVYHQATALLLCHHCGYREAVENGCSYCGAVDSLVNYGAGVERIAEEASELFPEARMLVLSTDLQNSSAHTKLALQKIVEAEVDLIIGTQIISKGHNFPFLTLVGVVDADAGLSFPDFRAAEHTFQQILQVTGRAGRTGLRSFGLLQSWDPRHPVIEALLRGDKESFFKHEIKARQASNLPPFGKLAALIVSSEDVNLAELYAQLLRQAADDSNQDIVVLGPSTAPLSYLRDKYRYRLLLHANNTANLQQYIRYMLNRLGTIPKKIDLEIDIDPISFF